MPALVATKWSNHSFVDDSDLLDCWALKGGILAEVSSVPPEDSGDESGLEAAVTAGSAAAAERVRYLLAGVSDATCAN